MVDLMDRKREIPPGWAWLAMILFGAAVWAALAWGLLMPTANADIGGFGIVYIDGVNVELVSPEENTAANTKICAIFDPGPGIIPIKQAGYGFLQWGQNKGYMYPTKVLGPITERRKICANLGPLNCGQTYYWRGIMLFQGLNVGFDKFGELVACGPQ